jgi:hypothetical protein
MSATNSAQTARKLHGWHHEDYEEARDQIFRQLGDLSENELFDNRVMVAVYIRPEKKVLPDGRVWYHTAREVREDVYQGAVVMVVQLGCDAFTGEPEFVKAKWNGRPPKPGDWVFLEAQQGAAFNVQGEGAETIMVEDQRGDPIPMFEWGIGWPVRVIRDTEIMGRVAKPHQVVG